MSNLIIRQINEHNWFDEVKRLYAEEMIIKENKSSADRIVKIYEGYIEQYHGLPSVIDIIDEINFNNMEVLETVTELFLQYDNYALARIDELTIQSENSRIDMSEEEIHETVSQECMGDLISEISSQGWEFSRNEIMDILCDAELAFFIDYDDDIYEEVRFMEKAGALFLINDCQLKLFPHQQKEFLINTLGQYAKDYEKCYNYIAFKCYDAVSKQSDTLSLGYSRGW